jgi:hypothetical protein
MASPAPLTAGQGRALAGLSRAGLLDGLYLAGGVAVAHHLGHRGSRDLDLFTRDATVDLDRFRERALAAVGGETISQTEATVVLRVAGTPVDVVRYPYPLVGRLARGPSGVLVASLRDLAAMKLAAIAKRGVRRDYWDLFEILTRTRLTMHRACDDYVRKFGVAEADLYHVLRALVWFEDADADPTPPRGLSRSRWRTIRAWFDQQAARELRRQSEPAGG